MPTITPSAVVQNALQAVTKDPKFATLSPQAQAAILKQASFGPMAPLDLEHNPALQAALAEARHNQLLSNDPLWKAVLKGTAEAAGVAVAGPALGALSGGGSAASAGTDATAASMAPGAEGGLASGAAAAGGAPVGAGTAIGTGVGSAVAPTVAKVAGSSSLLHDLLPSIIGAGTGLGGAAIAANANTEAAKIQAETAAKALAVQQQQYALQRQDTAPYRALGQGAVNNLGYLGGIDTTSNLAALSSTAPAIPSGTNPAENIAPVVALGAKDASGQPIPSAGMNQTIPRPPTPAQQGLSALSQPASSGTVRIQDPATGLVHLIPQTQAAAAQQAGGRLV